MTRRDFLKYGTAGLTGLLVGRGLPGMFENEANSQVVPVQSLNFTITDAIKGMVTDNTVNLAECYYWIFKEASIPEDYPGPNIFCTAGESIRISVTNQLDAPHAFFIPGVNPNSRATRPPRPVFDSGPIAPGETRSFRFRAPNPGTYLYFDNLNAPVNRVMGLHGAFIVMPRIPRTVAGRRPRNRVTPYLRATPGVQRLFNELGNSEHFPGLAWEQGDPSTDTPPFRQYVWLLHQSSPNLFEEVGRSAPGAAIRNPVTFVNAFLKDPFITTGKDTAASNRKAQYFTISGQSGHFAHNNSFICPMNRVGEPALVRVLNAGLWMHSLHIHANHVYVIAINGVVQENPIWVDTYTSEPLQTWDWLVPYMRPPDVPNARGIGLPDTPLLSLTGRPIWPPNEELGLFIPDVADNLAAQLSPMCYPMHDHSEPTQTSQGGNYNLGMISGINFTGDRNTAGGVTTFPHAPAIHGPDRTGPAGGPEE
jgi:FtsP/CotA-like multicopper oxidase with cupredoxin domain